MTNFEDSPGRIRRPLRLVTATLATMALVVGMGLTLLNSSPASAANVSIEQCNGINNTPGLTTNCSVTVVNTLTNDPATTGSVVTVNGVTTTSSDIVTAVTQGADGAVAMNSDGTVTYAPNVGPVACYERQLVSIADPPTPGWGDQRLELTGTGLPVR